MRIVISRHPLPTDFMAGPSGHLIRDEFDVAICSRGRLAVKVLVFDDEKPLRRYMREALGQRSGRALGAVTELAQRTGEPSGRGVVYADPRYFAVMLLRFRASLEEIVHESVHAGMAYGRRTKWRPIFPGSRDCREEVVCYAAGRASSLIAAFLGEVGGGPTAGGFAARSRSVRGHLGLGAETSAAGLPVRSGRRASGAR